MFLVKTLSKNKLGILSRQILYVQSNSWDLNQHQPDDVFEIWVRELYSSSSILISHSTLAIYQQEIHQIRFMKANFPCVFA